MDWLAVGAIGGACGAVLAWRRARSRRACRALLAPVQRVGRVEGWGGPLLVRRALEWRRGEDVVRLVLRRRSPGRVGGVSHWAAELRTPQPIERDVAAAALATLGSMRCEPTRLVLNHVIDSDHLVSFVRAAFPLLAPATLPVQPAASGT